MPEHLENHLSHSALCAEADRDLARRSIVGVFSYFIFWLIIYNTREFEQVNDALLKLLGFMLGAVAVGRLYLALRFNELYAAEPRHWRWLFAFGTIMSALVWSTVCVLALNYDRLGSISLMVMLSTACIASGGIVSLAPSARLGGFFVVFLLLPIASFALTSDATSERGVALLFLAFSIFMLLMWRRLHTEYWGALSGRFELASAKEAAETANLAKGQFIANVSHELRTPMTTIIGTLGLIKRSLPGNSPLQITELVEMACQNGKHLSTLINDILDFEKLNAGGMSFNCRPLALAPCIRRALELNKSYAERYQVSFVFENTLPEETRIVADELRLLQVMANLLSNAAKFSPAGEKVIISVREINGKARITISDCGPGVPETFRDHIFKKFSQADSSPNGKDQGTGLGLAISKAIIENMEGNIGFDSTGQGAAFYFDLPVAQPLHAAPESLQS